jgi:ABC-type transport system substrate-binding protein
MKIASTQLSHRFARAVLIAALAAAPLSALAKGTLVYCSEGSPEGFQPQFFTTGTTFDAVSVPMFNRLVEFEIGTTNIIPALAESWTVSPDGKSYTFKLRKGVKFHSNANFKPTRDFNADDVVFSWNRMADDNHPFHKMTAGQTFAYYEDMGMKNIVDNVQKVDDYTVRFNLKRPEARSSPTWRWTSRRSCRRNISRRCSRKGRPMPRMYIQSAPVLRIRFLSEGCDDPLQGVRPVLERSSESGQSGLCDHPRCHGALCEAQDG